MAEEEAEAVASQSQPSTGTVAPLTEQPGPADGDNAPAEQPEPVEEVEEVISALSTAALENKLLSLRDDSNKLSQALTQKLATSQSGQNLLHIGSSLSTLPPDLHALLTQLHPLLLEAESAEKTLLGNLQKLVITGNAVRVEQERILASSECASILGDLVAAEDSLKEEEAMKQTLSHQEEEKQEEATDLLDHVASLERAAYTALLLLQELHTSSENVSALTSFTSSTSSSTEVASLRSPLMDSEKAQFVMKLAPRIRKLAASSETALAWRFQVVLKKVQARRRTYAEMQDSTEVQESKLQQQEELLMIGHCLRGLVLLGKGQEAENVFARVAIMPLIRSKVSMGRLDEGGSRGECAGLFSLLQDMSQSIASSFGPVLRLAESMFDLNSNKQEIDLVTAGVWVPIATALMADAGIKMAIFSPGIARILQGNYVALDTFLMELATKLLTKEDEDEEGPELPKGSLARLYYSPDITTQAIQRAQQRIYRHDKTAEFNKRWNLPIYYQLRFGDCCTRLNTAIDRTQKEGWIAEVYSGSNDEFERLRQEYGFELPLFCEVFDVLGSLWKPDVYLRPLTHRFLRGAVQIIGRVIGFVSDGMVGKIEFGEVRKVESAKETNGSGDVNGDNVLDGSIDKPVVIARDPYKWGETLSDVAAVAWELTVFESKLTHDYVEAAKLTSSVKECSVEENEEIGKLVTEVMSDAALQISPLVTKAWNEVIVNLLIAKCCGPLAAVKGVAATYRMTNRPPPMKASHFVPTILRPLKDFNDQFRRRTPPSVGVRWKISIVTTVAQRYSVAVEELIATVQRTEVALQSRRRAKTAAGGMSDGEKVKLQLLLDYKEFTKSVQQVGVDPASVDGIEKLRTLTQEAAQKQSNGANNNNS